MNAVPPTEAVVQHAGRVLTAAGPRGHECALDAIAAALASPAPATVLTPDREDLLAQCGTRVRVVEI
ncbi:hypothetical protein [Streptomyces xinghaiensis]|uniref:hypothetical protein n=1 Tax=Streptomyces xinghaiensis TaxID=1038928 RepID=UPI002E0FB846